MARIQSGSSRVMHRIAELRFIAFIVFLVCALQGARASSKSMSVDEPFSFRKVQCPKYYLVGDYACGASTLFQHVKKELDIPGLNDQQQPALHAFDQLDAAWILNSQSTNQAIDGTDTTFRSLDAPLRLKALCDFEAPPKFVVTLCDPAARTWTQFKHNARLEQRKHEYTNQKGSTLDGRVSFDESLPDEYRKCVKLTLGQLQKCLDIMSFMECGHVLYGDSTPGAATIDSLGNKAPCNGVVFSSMYKALLDNWFSIFPQEDFLVLYGDDWIEQQPSAIEAIASHFGVSSSSGDFSNFEVDPTTIDKYYEKDETVWAPEDIQGELRRFFTINNGWQSYVNVSGDLEASNAVSRSDAVSYDFLLRSSCSNEELLRVIPTEDMEACQILCGEETDCAAFSFNFKSNTCYLSSWCGDISETDNSISGRKIDGSDVTRGSEKYRYLPMVGCNDHALETHEGFTAKQCEEACNYNPKCRAFASNVQRECYLKNSCRLQESYPGYLSAIRV